MQVTEKMKRDLAVDGAIAVRGLFSPNRLARMREAFDYGIAHPSPLHGYAFKGTPDEHFNDYGNIKNRDVQVTTLAVTTVGILVVVAEIAARATWFSNWHEDRNGGAIVLLLVAALAAVLAFGARMLSFAISRHREELADLSAAGIVTPDGLRKALEKLEADHTVLHHVSRATAHLWIVTPLNLKGEGKHAKVNNMFDTHPPLAERIAILRKLEGLDPNQRGPVDETATGVPIDLAQLSASTDRRATRQPIGSAAVAAPASAPGGNWMHGQQGPSVPGGSATQTNAPTAPGWYHADATTLRYWDGKVWTNWSATWDGHRWVQSR